MWSVGAGGDLMDDERLESVEEDNASAEDVAGFSDADVTELFESAAAEMRSSGAGEDGVEELDFGAEDLYGSEDWLVKEVLGGEPDVVALEMEASETGDAGAPPLQEEGVETSEQKMISTDALDVPVSKGEIVQTEDANVATEGGGSKEVSVDAVSAPVSKGEIVQIEDAKVAVGDSWNSKELSADTVSAPLSKEEMVQTDAKLAVDSWTLKDLSADAVSAPVSKGEIVQIEDGKVAVADSWGSKQLSADAVSAPVSKGEIVQTEDAKVAAAIDNWSSKELSADAVSAPVSKEEIVQTEDAKVAAAVDGWSSKEVFAESKTISADAVDAPVSKGEIVQTEDTKMAAAVDGWSSKEVFADPVNVPVSKEEIVQTEDAKIAAAVDSWSPGETAEPQMSAADAVEMPISKREFAPAEIEQGGGTDNSVKGETAATQLVAADAVELPISKGELGQTEVAQGEAVDSWSPGETAKSQMVASSVNVPVDVADAHAVVSKGEVIETQVLRVEAAEGSTCSKVEQPRAVAPDRVVLPAVTKQTTGFEKLAAEGHASDKPSEKHATDKPSEIRLKGEVLVEHKSDRRQQQVGAFVEKLHVAAGKHKQEQTNRLFSNASQSYRKVNESMDGLRGWIRYSKAVDSIRFDSNGVDQNQNMNSRRLLGAAPSVVAEGKAKDLSIRGLRSSQLGEVRRLLGAEIALCLLLSAAAVAKGANHGEDDECDADAKASAVRETHTVGLKDTLESISEQYFGNTEFAWLLAEINVGCTRQIVDGTNLIVHVQEGTAVDLPNWEELRAFHYREKENTPRNGRVVTIVAANRFQKEAIESLALAMGYAHAG